MTISILICDDLPDLTQRHAIIAQADALHQQHCCVERVVTISAVAADWADDTLVFIVLQQVGGYPQVFRELSDPIFFHTCHLRKKESRFCDEFRNLL